MAVDNPDTRDTKLPNHIAKFLFKTLQKSSFSLATTANIANYKVSHYIQAKMLLAKPIRNLSKQV